MLSDYPPCLCCPGAQGHGSEVSPRTSARLRLKSVKLEPECEDDTHGTAGMSLDVLAQVASETWENEPRTPKKGRPKKMSMRSIQALEVLELAQIRDLTDRRLLRLFSEVSANELSRKFTYTCQLMPKLCHANFSSFGSDMRSKAEMKKHLSTHLDDLAIQENDHPEMTTFTAEPVQVRMKRMMNAVLPARRKKGRPRNLDDIQKLCEREAEAPASLDSDFTHIKDGINEDEMQAISHGIESYLQSQKHQAADNEQASLLSKTVTIQSSPALRLPLAAKYRVPKHRYWPTVKGLKKGVPGEGPSLSDVESDSETERKIEENEQFIIDLLGKRQPSLDHNYTSIFGKRRGAEMVHHLQDSDDEAREDGDIDVGDNVLVFMDCAGKTKPSPAHPILFLRHRSPNENVPMVSMEEIIDNKEPHEPDEDGSVVHSGEKPYPPMPKSALAQRGRIDIPEELCDEEEYLRRRKKSQNPMGREGREGGLGWEPKLALRYIRQLKRRRRDEVFPLKCLICKDKSFTAMATLMYHYRSHAGIKPFVCLICNTTFTRQHSLNYHMLIHNNQSRFSCKDCGRKFRHPSHFKEHLRRHTGETPFECLDCTQKFKTRNTYKRHLKTRHGKLLTASGIHLLSKEEFMKVRTKPYNIPNPSVNKTIVPDYLYSKLKGKVKQSKVADVDLTQMDVVTVKMERGTDEGFGAPGRSLLERNPDNYISKIERKVLTIGLQKPKSVLEHKDDSHKVIVHVA